MLSTADSNLTITVVFDNNRYMQDCRTDWGFSALITGTEKTILFDTGADGRMLLDNMKKLHIDTETIDSVVLSHKHQDHTGGLNAFLNRNNNVKVYLLDAFGVEIKNRIKAFGAEPVSITGPVEICPSVSSTAARGRLIKEQALMINTDKGIILITGCAHPGILKIAEFAGDYNEHKILLAIGGFHLEWSTSSKIQKIINHLKQLPVHYAAPAHCTGDKARDMFRRHFKDNYIETGAGRAIRISELKL